MDEPRGADPTVLLVLAALLVSSAIILRLGPSDGLALAMVVVAAGLTAWATVRPPSRAVGLRAVVWIVFVVQAVVWVWQLWSQLGRVAGEPLRFAAAAAAGLVALVAGADLLRRRPGMGRGGLAVFLAAMGVVGGIATIGFPTNIDVLVFHEFGTDRLLSGENPYAPGYPNPYSAAATEAFYGPGLASEDELHFGYPYPPLTLLLSVPGALLGDVRIAHLAAVLAAAWLMARIHGGRWRGRVGAVLFLLSPPVFFVTALSFTEPFLILLLAALLWSHVRGTRWVTDVLFGLFVVSKQYVVLLAPLYLLLLPRPWTWRVVAPPLARAAAVALVVTLPLALWDLGEFWWSVVELQFHQPFRSDAMSLLAASVNASDWPPPWTYAVLPLLAGVGALAAVLRWGPRTASGVAAGAAVVMFAFLLLSKQAFTNYYFLVVGLLTLAVAAWAPGDEDRRDVLVGRP